MDTDTHYMKLALELAGKGRGYTSPNPMVGAVIVNNGKVVGRGWHEYPGGPHAEINAIRDAGELARDATLYVTLEPCNHFGRTPPCTKAVLDSGIRRVVVAMTDPNPLVDGGGNDYLKANGVVVSAGICEAEARTLNRFFLKHTRTGLPYVILKCAATLDGKIATAAGDSKWITGEAARRHVHELRHAVDAIMVGVRTVKADDPSLTTRLPRTEGSNPLRIILDTRLTIPENSKVLQGSQVSGTLLVTGGHTCSEKRKRLIDKNVRIIETPLKDDRIDLVCLMSKLGRMNITSILVEGGGQVSSAMLKESLVDRINFFYAPKILAGDGISICSGPGPQKISEAIRIENMEIRRFGEDILIEGDVGGACSPGS